MVKKTITHAAKAFKPTPETLALREGASRLLDGDPRYLAGLTAYPCAFENAIHRELLEAVAAPLRETNDIAEVCDRLDAAGKAALADLLVKLASDSVVQADRRRTWRSLEYYALSSPRRQAVRR